VPEVSVVIPTRDRLDELDRALGLALAQRDVTLEVIVVDDGSAVPVLSPRDDARVRILRLEGEGSVARARNQGILAATGRWIAFLDDDDLWAPDRLAKLVALGEAGDADVVIGGTIALDPEGRGLRMDPIPDPLTLQDDLTAYNVLGGPSSVMVRRSVLRDAGGFDESFAVLADWELWIRLAESRRVVVHPEALTGYLVHRDGMHVRETDRAMREFRVLVERHERGRRAMVDKHFMRWAGSAHRRAGRRFAAARLYWRNWRRHGETTDLLRAGVTLLGERAMRRAGRRLAGPEPTVPAWVRESLDHPRSSSRASN
jgi:glycosyltransferase involved in cell wall biosynthesis